MSKPHSNSTSVSIPDTSIEDLLARIWKLEAQVRELLRWKDSHFVRKDAVDNVAPSETAGTG